MHRSACISVYDEMSVKLVEVILFPLFFILIYSVKSMRDSVFGVELDCNQCTVQETDTYQTVLNKLTMDVTRTRFGVNPSAKDAKISNLEIVFPAFFGALVRDYMNNLNLRAG